MCRNYELPAKEIEKIEGVLMEAEELDGLEYYNKVDAYKYFMDRVEATYLRVMQKDLGKMSAHGPMPCAQFHDMLHNHAICIECNVTWPCSYTEKTVADVININLVLDIKNAMEL